MANSTSDNLKLTVQATGENSGTWGQITNTNLLILEQAIGGYSAITVNATTGATLTFSNGALSNGKDQVIKLTGTITGNINVVIPDSVEKTYVIENATSGAFTVTVKTTSGTGVTWGTTDKGTKMVYSDGTNVVDTAFTEVSSDITPQLSGNLDTNGNNIEFDNATGITDDSQQEQLTFSKTASAVNNIQIKNAATSTSPEISAIGDDTNIDLTITPKGSGNVILDGLKYPNADGTCGQVLTTDGSGNITFADAGGGAVSWNTTPITADPANAVAGTGYFANTTSAAFTITLPTSPSAGDIVAIKDYALTFHTNNLTVARNGQPIDGGTADAVLNIKGQATTFIYVDGTQGWKAINNDSADFAPAFITATGGTVTCCGDYKIHTFTSPGTFCVTDAGNAAGNNKISYVIIGGGGGGGSTNSSDDGAGGGAGGYREGKDSCDPFTASPLATCAMTLTSLGAYTVTVGGGGAGGPGTPQVPGTTGSDSGFNAISGAGGGAARGSGGGAPPSDANGGSGGGSGGGAGVPGPAGGSGNVPFQSPPQGQPGGASATAVPDGSAGGGGGAGQAGQTATSVSANGGNGVTSSINATPTARAGGGGAATANGGTGGGGNSGQAGTANTGGGGGGNQGGPSGASGGSGIVIIRYKYQ